MKKKANKNHINTLSEGSSKSTTPSNKQSVLSKPGINCQKYVIKINNNFLCKKSNTRRGSVAINNPILTSSETNHERRNSEMKFELDNTKKLNRKLPPSREAKNNKINKDFYSPQATYKSSKNHIEIITSKPSKEFDSFKKMINLKQVVKSVKNENKISSKQSINPVKTMIIGDSILPKYYGSSLETYKSKGDDWFKQSYNKKDTLNNDYFTKTHTENFAMYRYMNI